MDRRQFSATLAALVSCAVSPIAKASEEPLRGFALLERECAARGLKAYSDFSYCSAECHVLLLVGAVGNVNIEASSFVSRKDLLERDRLVSSTIDDMAEDVVREIFLSQPLAIYG